MKLSLGLEFRTIQIMREELIPMEEISRVISQLTAQSPHFHDAHLNEEKIISSYKEFNNILVQKRLPAKELKEYYSLVESTCAVAVPLLALFFMEPIVESFSNIAKRNYNVEHPFDVHFLPADKENLYAEVEDEMDIETIPMYKIRGEISRADVNIKFKAGKSLRQEIDQELWRLYESLGHEYSRTEHFEFSGLYNVCFPLFKVGSKKEESYHKLNRRLNEDEGSFQLYLPEEFRQD